ncbi:MAG: hypothetical protein DRP84_10375, partial [Spirochaetes bacterium]
MPKKKQRKEEIRKGKPLMFLRNEYVFSLVAYFVTITVLFSPVFFCNKSFTSPDQLSSTYTFFSLKKHLNEGIYPLWNPYIFSGMPAFSALSFNLFVYLPMLLYYPFTLIGIPGLIFTVLHYLIAGFGTFLLLRRWKLKPIPAFFGGLAYMIMPY